MAITRRDMNMDKKKCFKCGEEKDLSMFYAHRQMGDGHLNKCIDCTKLDVRNHRSMNADRIREYDRNRPNKKERMARVKIYNNPAKNRARRIAYRAMKAGRIIKTRCHFCGSDGKVEMHHPNYDEPLLVYFLCRVCHKKHEAIVRSSTEAGVSR